MNRMIKLIAILFGILPIFSVTAFAGDKISAFVSIAPQKYFVKQIGKNLIEVSAMVEPGESPATYEPKPKQMSRLSTTEIYFAIGVPFEKRWLKKIGAVNPDMKIVHTDQDIEKLAMPRHLHLEFDHKSTKNEDTELDPHIWLSPELVKKQIYSIMTALREIDPKHMSIYEANFRKFEMQIDKLNADIRKIFADKKGMSFMVFHPAWGYFANTYGLRQLPIEIEGKSPKPAMLKELILYAVENEIRAIFVQPQFSAKSAVSIAREIGGVVAFADPLSEDWADNLRSVASKFDAAFK